MSCFSGPKISNNGLVFSYDMNNPKSFDGPPTTNYQWNGGLQYDPWTVYGINTDVSGTSEAGPVKNMKTWKFQKTGTSSQWNGWEGSYGPWTGSAGDIWTTSYWYKTSAPAGLTSFGVGAFYLSDWSRGYSTTILSNRNSIIADGTWRWNYTVTQINEAYTNAIIVDGPSWGYSTSAGLLYINGLHWNKNAYSSLNPARGTRTTANTLFDLTGRSSISANSLTYPYDGNSSEPFSFTSNNYIQLANDLGYTTEVSAFAWFKHSGTPPGNYHIIFGGGELELSIPTSGEIRTGIYTNIRYVSNHGSGLLDGKWHYVGFTFSGTTKTSYIDGVNVGTQTTSGSLTYNFANRTMGRYGNDTSYYANGSIALASIHNRALSDSEVKQNFNALRGRFGI